MMMNFKKNQNNAVCSMDCKNCPHGASQPNPMDDPMFEKSIAKLHNWLMLEAIREDHPKERIVMVILPGAGGELLTEDGSRDIFEDVYDEMEADLVADGLGTAAGTVFADLCGSGHDAGVVGYHLCHRVWPNGGNLPHGEPCADSVRNLWKP